MHIVKHFWQRLDHFSEFFTITNQISWAPITFDSHTWAHPRPGVPPSENLYSKVSSCWMKNVSLLTFWFQIVTMAHLELSDLYVVDGVYDLATFTGDAQVVC